MGRVSTVFVFIFLVQSAYAGPFGLFGGGRGCGGGGCVPQGMASMGCGDGGCIPRGIPSMGCGEGGCVPQSNNNGNNGNQLFDDVLNAPAGNVAPGADPSIGGGSNQVAPVTNASAASSHGGATRGSSRPVVAQPSQAADATVSTTGAKTPSGVLDSNSGASSPEPEEETGESGVEDFAAVSKEFKSSDKAASADSFNEKKKWLGACYSEGRSRGTLFMDIDKDGEGKPRYKVQRIEVLPEDPIDLIKLRADSKVFTRLPDEDAKSFTLLEDLSIHYPTGDVEKNSKPWVMKDVSEGDHKRLVVRVGPRPGGSAYGYCVLEPEGQQAKPKAKKAEKAPVEKASEAKPAAANSVGEYPYKGKNYTQADLEKLLKAELGEDRVEFYPGTLPTCDLKGNCDPGVPGRFYAAGATITEIRETAEHKKAENNKELPGAKIQVPSTRRKPVTGQVGGAEKPQVAVPSVETPPAAKPQVQAPTPPVVPPQPEPLKVLGRRQNQSFFANIASAQALSGVLNDASRVGVRSIVVKTGQPGCPACRDLGNTINGMVQSGRSQTTAFADADFSSAAAKQLRAAAREQGFVLQNTIPQTFIFAQGADGVWKVSDAFNGAPSGKDLQQRINNTTTKSQGAPIR